MDDSTRAAEGDVGTRGSLSLFGSSCCLVFLAMLSLFNFAFSTFSPPLFGWLLSPFSLTFQPHYTASEQNSGRQLLEMVHLLKMKLIASTRFRSSHSERRRTTPSLVEDRKLTLGCKTSLLKKKKLTSMTMHIFIVQHEANMPHITQKDSSSYGCGTHPTSSSNKNKNPHGYTAVAIQINKII